MSIDAVDALRVESQSISPHLQTLFSHAATQTQYALESMYGKYINTRFVEKNETVSERLIVVSDMGSMFERWNHNPMLGTKSLHKTGGLFGFSLQNNGLIYIQDPHIVWEKMPDLLKDMYALNVGLSAEKAEMFFYKEFADQVTTHEVFHQYQDITLEESFSEMGAHYYQKKISDRYRRRARAMQPNPNITDAYANLLFTFGSDVHRLTFGSLKSSRKKNEILDRARYDWYVLQSEGLIGED